MSRDGDEEEVEEDRCRVRTEVMISCAWERETCRFEPGTKIKPRRSAPASVAVRAASGVLSPQILTSGAVVEKAGPVTAETAD